MIVPVIIVIINDRHPNRIDPAIKMSDKYKFKNGVSHRSSCLGSILRKSNHSDSESRKFLNENYPDKNIFSTIDFNDSSVGRKGQRSSKSCNTETAQMYEVYCQQMRWSSSNT